MGKQHNSARRPGEFKTKVCCNCEKRKPIEQFSIYKRRNSDETYRRGRCKKCINAYHVARRQRSAEVRKQHYAYVRNNQTKLIAHCDELRRSTPCADCGGTFNPWQMQFDHIRGEKVENVMQLALNGSTRLMMEEIEKCEIVCANCHADRTHRRRECSKRRVVAKQ